MKSSVEIPSFSVAMYIASFHPRPMGGMEMQGLRLARQLKLKGIEVVIFTHGGKGDIREDQIDGVTVVRMYSWMNAAYDLLRKMISKIKPAGRKSLPDDGSFGSLPYDPADTGLKINGSFLDLVFYLIQILNFSWKLNRYCKGQKLIHVHGVPWVSFVAAAVGRIHRIPVLVKESTTIGFKKFDDMIFGRAMRGYVLKHCSFAAISHFIYKILLEYKVPAQRIYYIPNGVSLPDKDPLPPADTGNILFVGNLTQGAAKGLDVLLQALPEVAVARPDVKLLIAGKAGNLDKWMNYLHSLGIASHVSFFGSQNNLQEIYNRTAVFVSPSRREGLSNALLESMAAGLPCIVTDISGSQDMITDGVNGYVVDVNDPSQLAKAIIDLLSSVEKRNEMGAKAFEKVKYTCSFEKISQSYIEIYSGLLRNEYAYAIAENQAQA